MLVDLPDAADRADQLAVHIELELTGEAVGRAVQHGRHMVDLAGLHLGDDVLGGRFGRAAPRSSGPFARGVVRAEDELCFGRFVCVLRRVQVDRDPVVGEERRSRRVGGHRRHAVHDIRGEADARQGVGTECEDMRALGPRSQDSIDVLGVRGEHIVGLGAAEFDGRIIRHVRHQAGHTQDRFVEEGSDQVLLGGVELRHQRVEVGAVRLAEGPIARGPVRDDLVPIAHSGNHGGDQRQRIRRGGDILESVDRDLVGLAVDLGRRLQGDLFAVR